MAFYNFGHAATTMRNAFLTNADRSISPSSYGITIMDQNIGDTFGSQIAKLNLMGSEIDFLWGCHLWGSKKYRVVKR